MEKKAVSHLPSHRNEADTPSQQDHHAVVTDVQNNIPITVKLNDVNVPVLGYYTMTTEFMPTIKLGDNVLVKIAEAGAYIVAIRMKFDAPARVRFSVKDDNLVIEAKGSVLLKNEHATIELTKDGAIFIDGQNVRTVAEQTLTLLGGKVLMN